jgi:diguanylate cyclase (GGDEF)-like protein/PAS domain S-box-containing protein
LLGQFAAWLRSRRPAAAPAAKRAPATELDMLLRNSHDLILRLSGDKKFTYVSPASMHIFGLPPEEMLGRALRDYAHPEDRPGLVARGELLFSGQIDDDTSCFRITRKDGAVRWVEVNTRRERDMFGDPTGDYVIVLRDVTANRELQQQLAGLASTDGLTGLANRRAFDETLDRAWRNALRYRRQMSLLLLDVDLFKKFNDCYGHHIGDQCLRAIGASVSGVQMRPCDLVARYGGEELAVILPETNGPGAVEVAGRILQAVRDLKIPHEQNCAGEGFVSVSIGVATAVTVASVMSSSATALIAAADRALYNAKDAGRNQVATALLITSGNGPTDFSSSQRGAVSL